MSEESVAIGDRSTDGGSDCPPQDHNARRELDADVTPEKKVTASKGTLPNSEDNARTQPDASGECAGVIFGVGNAPVDVERAFETFAKPIESFLLGVLRNGPEARDALQATFVKLMEKKDTIVKGGALKSWLFRVAYNEAMLIKRKDGIVKKHIEKLAWTIAPTSSTPGPIEEMLAEETKEQVIEALETLSDGQRAVVQKRIYEGLKFREIAEQLDLPLGTVLARMHTSLSKLKSKIENEI